MTEISNTNQQLKRADGICKDQYHFSPKAVEEPFGIPVQGCNFCKMGECYYEGDCENKIKYKFRLDK